MGESEKPATLREQVESYERVLIMDALKSSDGNQRRAAQHLGGLPTTLSEKMKRLGIPRPGRGGRR